MKNVKFIIQIVVTVLLTAVTLFADQSFNESHEAVLQMGPVGYWPADEGDGEFLHDLSGNDNHGILHHVAWAGGLLDFTGAYQWAEIPNHCKYQSRDFSIGGWVFTRNKIYGGLYPGKAGMIFIGNAYHHSGYTLETLYNDPVLFNKSEWTVAGGTEEGISLCVRKDELVDIISGGKSDAVGSLAGGVSIAVGKWQHVFYTYESGMPIRGGDQWRSRLDSSIYYGAGTGKLYVNGELVKSEDDIKFDRRDMRFLIGSDAVWWLQSDRSGSLDGSIRDIVMFERAFSQYEVKKLVENTKPGEAPKVFDDDALIINGREVELSKLDKLCVEDRRAALEQIQGRKDKPVNDELMEVLKQTVKDPRTSLVSVKLLVQMNHKDTDATLRQSVGQLVRLIEDDESSLDVRAEAALALAEMGQLAEPAVPIIVKRLESLSQQDDENMPRVENVFRNSLLRALLDIAPKDESVREVIGESFAKPVLNAIDLFGPDYNKIRKLVKSRKYMDALTAYRLLPRDLRMQFFSYGDPRRDARGYVHDRSYTAVAEHEGFVYKLGEGKGFQGVEAISPEEFKEQAEKLSLDYPEAKNWRKANDPHLYRVGITKTGVDGHEQKTFLEGRWFIFDGHDAKVRGWSIAVDADGYLHVTGGKHNFANPDHYIPGSWERMGASRNYTDDNFPSLLYWVSQKPGDINSLKFVGQRANARNVPVPDGLNYMNFVQDRNGVLYLYGRIHVQGIQSWGLYRYDTNARRWTGVGGFAPDVTNDFPQWSDRHIEMACDSFALCTMRWKNTDPDSRVLAWSLQPHFYNYCRSMWGVKFDVTNRMHVQVPIFGLDDNNHNINKNLYAFSDDGGETFYRADGTVLALPLTANPGPGQAAMSSDCTEQWWQLWQSLLQYAGL